MACAPLPTGGYVEDEIAMQTILLAEDDQNDMFFTARLFDKCGVLNPLQVVSNGREAIHYIKGEDRYADRVLHPVPILMLLDWKMPLMNGMEVLRWLQTQPKPSFPIIILTAFQDLKTMNEAYRLGAKSFLMKPIREEDLLPLIRGVPGVQFKI